MHKKGIDALFMLVTYILSIPLNEDTFCWITRYVKETGKRENYERKKIIYIIRRERNWIERKKVRAIKGNW